MLLMCAFVCFQRGPTLGVFQATIPRPKHRSFTYPNLAAVYHVSKPCSSLSRIQTLQQSFMYPKLASSSLEDVPQVHQITDFKLCYTRNTHYDSVVALDGDLCSEFYAPVLLTSTKLKMRVLERNASDGVNPIILIQLGSLYLTRLESSTIGIIPTSILSTLALHKGQPVTRIGDRLNKHVFSRRQCTRSTDE